MILVLALLAGCSEAPPPPPEGGAPAEDSQPGDVGGGDSAGGDSAGGAATGRCQTAEGSVLQLDGPCPVNLLLVSIDTLRRDRLGAYGGAGDTSPLLDRLLGEGVTLDRLRSCANWTYPAMACLLTGSSSTDQSFIPVPEEAGQQDFPERLETLSEMMVSRGYQTALVGSQFLFTETVGLTQGYQVLDVRDTWPAGDLTERALEVAGQLAEGGPWFLHVHLLDPHDPYDPPDAYKSAAQALSSDWERYADIHRVADDWAGLDAEERALASAVLFSLYDGEIRYLDDSLEGFFAALEAGGALEQTLVVLVADHGEQFWDHGEAGHGQALYNEETLVMGGFWARGLRPARGDWPAAQRDLIPTALDALQLEGDANVTGGIIGVESPDRASFSMMASWGEVVQSVDQGALRLHYRWSTGQHELYDLSSDPGELDDLCGRQPEAAAELQALLEPEIAALDALLAISPKRSDALCEDP